jgi:hypothetical protein
MVPLGQPLGQLRGEPVVVVHRDHDGAPGNRLDRSQHGARDPGEILLRDLLEPVPEQVIRRSNVAPRPRAWPKPVEDDLPSSCQSSVRRMQMKMPGGDGAPVTEQRGDEVVGIARRTYSGRASTHASHARGDAVALGERQRSGAGPSSASVKTSEPTPG